MAETKVSVIVVSNKAGKMLDECVASLERQAHSELEIIVVDNGSGTDIASKFSLHKVVTLSENLGFAGGNNAGITAATGNYIALINDDAFAESDWISRMLVTFNDIEDCGAVASAVIDGNRPELMDSCGVVVALDGMSRQACHGHPVSSVSARKEVLAFSGCGCMIRRDVLDITGLFDEQFFAYCEDTDLSLRIIKAGFRIVFEPKSRISHLYSHTGGKFSLNKVYWIERNHFWVAVKNYPVLLIALLPFLTLWRFILQTFFISKKNSTLRGFMKNSPFSLAITLLRAQLTAIRYMPNMIRKKREFRPTGGISEFRLLGLILRFKADLKEIIG